MNYLQSQSSPNSRQSPYPTASPFSFDFVSHLFFAMSLINSVGATLVVAHFGQAQDLPLRFTNLLFNRYNFRLLYPRFYSNIGEEKDFENTTLTFSFQIPL